MILFYKLIGSNIFFVRDNILCTPSINTGILDGITRGIVLDLAGEAGIKTKEGCFRLNDIYKSQEVFISNTTMEIMPVSRVDDTVIKGTGQITGLLRTSSGPRRLPKKTEATTTITNIAPVIDSLAST